MASTTAIDSDTDTARPGAARPNLNGGPAMRTRPLCRDYGGDPRSLELAASIEAHQRAISQHEGAMLAEIAEFDRSEAWRGDGAFSMGAWLTARCHVGAGRSRTLVETAAKVDVLPRLCAALRGGSLTLDVMAPLAAVCPANDDAEVAAQAVNWTPKQARAWAADVEGERDPDAKDRFERRHVRFNDEKCSLWGSFAKDSYAAIKAAIMAKATLNGHPNPSDEDYEPLERRCADALYDLCTGAAGAHGVGVTLIVHVDLGLLVRGDGYGYASIEGVGPISAEVARRLACDASVTVSFDAPDGTCLDQKPLRRTPTPAQRIEIARRDDGCRFPGCGCKHPTQAHHVVWASKQGPTVLSNLLTLCSGHHSRVHELGWKLDGDANATVTFTGPNGSRLTSVPSPTWRRTTPMRK